jgi:hypothetical protein
MSFFVTAHMPRPFLSSPTYPSSVEVDPESEVSDPLGYGDSMDAERFSWPTVLAETEGVSGRSSPVGSEISRMRAGEACAEIARRVASFTTACECAPNGAIASILSCQCCLRVREESKRALPAELSYLGLR